MSFKYYEDPILGKGRAQVDNGSGGSGGSSYVGGDRINIAGGTISFVNSADIVNVTGTSVTLQPDTAYKIYATSQAITLNANPPAAGKWAYEGHLEIFTAGAGYVVTGSNVVLANALEPDAVNNCTVRFHDGIAIIAVEDHVAGYIVVNGSTAGDGSLAYGIATSTNDYIAFDASLNGTTIPLAGAVAEGEKHVVGNGYEQTTLTGAVDCGTSKFTMANLALSNVQITGGVMTLGDAFIPSGSTVAVSGGGLAVEKVTGAGETSVINLSGTSASILLVDGEINISGVAFVDSPAARVFYVAPNPQYSPVVNLNNVVFSGNINRDITCGPTGTVNMNGCVTRNIIQLQSGGSIALTGSNTFSGYVGGDTTGGTVLINSGATIDLTGNPISIPIAPGGGITFESGGASVLYSSGTVSGSYMMDNVTLPAGAKLTNTAVVDLSNNFVIVSSGTTAIISGCSLTGGSHATAGGAFAVNSGGNCVFDHVAFSGNNTTAGGRAFSANGDVTVVGCSFARTPDQTVFLTGGTCLCSDTQMPIALQTQGTSPKVVIAGSCSQPVGAIVGFGGGSTSGGAVYIESGAIFDMTGNSRMPNPVIQTGGGIVVAGGDSTKSATVTNSAGTSIPITGGTYSKLMDDGTIE